MNGAIEHIPISKNGHGKQRAAPPVGYEAYSVNVEWMVGGAHPSELTHPPGYTQEMSWERARSRDHCLCPCKRN